MASCPSRRIVALLCLAALLFLSLAPAGQGLPVAVLVPFWIVLTVLLPVAIRREDVAEPVCAAPCLPYYPPALLQPDRSPFTCSCSLGRPLPDGRGSGPVNRWRRVSSAPKCLRAVHFLAVANGSSPVFRIVAATSGAARYWIRTFAACRFFACVAMPAEKTVIC